ncbi:hypothetical protein [Actinoplanes xinjiangensis]|uniref:hypothetical protein n=1 Tax=Actinoplanes xinjiangensis TaxID=512350 RepID=UPI0034132F90
MVLSGHATTLGRPRATTPATPRATPATPRATSPRRATSRATPPVVAGMID